MTTREAPKDGIYFDISASEYRAWPLVSQSALRVLCLGGTPAHYRASQAEEHTESLAMDAGTLGHTALLEPTNLETRRILPPEIKRRSGADWLTLQAEHPEVTYMSPSEWTEWAPKRDKAIALADAVRRDPTAGKLFGAGIKSEVSIVWTDIDTGVRCKGRIDFYGKDGAYIGDLKTYGFRQRSKTPLTQYQVLRQGWWRGMHIQAAMYADGLRTADRAGKPVPFYFVFAELEKPHNVFVADGRAAFDERGGNWSELEPDEATAYYRIGRDAYKAALHTIEMCERSGEWPGFGHEVMSMVIPGTAE